MNAVATKPRARKAATPASTRGCPQPMRVSEAVATPPTDLEAHALHHTVCAEEALYAMVCDAGTDLEWAVYTLAHYAQVEAGNGDLLEASSLYAQALAVCARPADAGEPFFYAAKALLEMAKTHVDEAFLQAEKKGRAAQ